MKFIEIYDFFTNRKTKNSHGQITYSTKVSHYLDEKTLKAVNTLNKDWPTSHTDTSQVGPE